MVDPVDDCTVTRIDKDGGRHIVAEIDGDYNQPDTWPIMEANARLIAAAPEMYEALKDIEDECTAAIAHEGGEKADDIPNGLRTVAHIKLSMIRAKARAALSKAGGGNG